MKTELTLPIELYNLGLEEIGAIFILMSSPHMGYRLQKYWEEHQQFRDTVAILTEDEIVVTKENGELQIDLTWV